MSENENKLKITIICSRRIPRTSGGFETFAERLAEELDLRIEEKN